jgi:molecular chaperone DnaJ
LKNPYEILGVSPNASKDDIHKAYRKLAAEWHPDLHPPEKKAEVAERFKEINAAFEALEKQQEQPKTPFDAFDHFFGNMARPIRQGDHVLLNCHVTLEQVLTGTKFDLKYLKKKLCNSCGGAGGEQVNCPTCQGKGMRTILGKGMVVQVSCEQCGSTGKVLSSQCGCDGGFAGAEEKSLTFDVPPGVEDGMRFAFRGQGQTSPDPNGLPGNLYVEIHYVPHACLTPMGNGVLHYTASVTYTQLVLGAEIEVPGLQEKLTLKIPAGTQPHRKFRLIEKGLPVFSNRTGGIYNRSDLLVEMDLIIPTELTGRHKEIVEELALLEEEHGKPQK